MQVPSTIDLPPDLYERVHRMAQHRHRPVPELIADALDLAEENDNTDSYAGSINWAEPDEAVEREQMAYRTLHSHLWATYPNQYVAVFDGVLIDHDSDGAALSERIEQRYPEQFVLIRRVEQSAERVLYFRSPKIMRHRSNSWSRCT